MNDRKNMVEARSKAAWNRTTSLGVFGTFPQTRNYHTTASASTNTVAILLLFYYYYYCYCDFVKTKV